MAQTVLILGVCQTITFIYILFLQFHLDLKDKEITVMESNLQVKTSAMAMIQSNATCKPRLPVLLVPDMLRPGKLLKPNINDAAAVEIAFYRTWEQIHCRCMDQRRIGHKGDGGWDVCFDPPFAMKQNNCLIYSFGIARDWSFDDGISKQYGCEVHSFDPTIHQPDHKRSERIFFHNVGIKGDPNGTDSLTEKVWKGGPKTLKNAKTLKEIRTMLKHEKKIIDYLKIDVESCELFSFPTMFRDGDLWTVKQLALELHVGHMPTERKVMVQLMMLQLELMGFQRYHYHQNKATSFKSIDDRYDLTGANEIYYINTNFYY